VVRPDTAMNLFGMLTDLLPLVVMFLPAGECGVMPLSTQLIMLAAAMLNTGMRIVTTLSELLPVAWAVVPFLVCHSSARWGPK
jgi:hypothetical protein